MTHKEELIKQINELPQELGVKFVEELDDGRINERTIEGKRENLIKILEEKFDDDLHGHFGDEVYTNIMAMGTYLITVTQV
jgi:hypothetical protein